MRFLGYTHRYRQSLVLRARLTFLRAGNRLAAQDRRELHHGNKHVHSAFPIQKRTNSTLLEQVGVRPRRRASASTQTSPRVCVCPMVRQKLRWRIKLSWQVVNYHTREHQGNGDEKSRRVVVVCRLKKGAVESSFRSIHDTIR